MNESYIESPLKKLEEAEAKAQLHNNRIKSELDIKGNERHFARQELQKDARNIIKIILMGFFGVMIIFFIVLVFMAGIYPSVLPQSEGVAHLEDLFGLIVTNSKIILLIALGYFFREYAADVMDKVAGEGVRQK